MTNYDFLVLSPYEFENLSRDLLQKKLSVFIESFTPGRDSGIDLRYTTDKSKNVIIQAKRYTSYSQLVSVLKKEVDNVKTLKPSRYIVTTTVGLTPKNKDEIKQLFDPFLLSTEDILAKDDLNNLVGQFSDIEQKYYKLWLSGTHVLQKIVHSKIYNQSEFQLETIKDKIQLFVQNNSFKAAIKILNNHRHVIISGIPGIGKTTLSRILVMYLLSVEYEEFVYLQDNIDDAYTFFATDKKQVFLFDDFLGKNYFSAKQHQNVDDKIVQFIEVIKKSPNKLLILATREYILQQALTSFESFTIHQIEIAKCILDLSSYTNLIKAQIIYNHLFFANVPEAHIKNLVENRKYMALVNHPNYNPRIIETVINRRIWEHCTAEEFTKAFKSYFDNPESVWKFAFENSLDKFSQYCLLVLLTMGTPVLLTDLELALKSFLKINNYKFFIAFDSISFSRAIRELENTFIRTQKDRFNKISVEYQNPSIQDFLVNYLRDKDDMIESLLEAAIFSEQFFTVFSSKENNTSYGFQKIALKPQADQIAFDRISIEYENITSCSLTKLHYELSKDYSWSKNAEFKFSFLRNIFENLAPSNKKAEEFVYRKFQESILIDTWVYGEQRSYINLLKVLDKNRLQFNEEQIVDTFVTKMSSIFNVEIFSEFEKIFPTTFKDTIDEESFGEILSNIVKEEVKSIKDPDIEFLSSQIDDLVRKYEWSFDEEIKELKKRQSDFDAYIDSQVDNYLDEMREEPDLPEEQENRQIDDLFDSLVD